MKYVIITPAKNEGEYIENTINSIISQVILPQEWIIVDDGSDDNTVELIEKYLTQYSWIKLIKRKTKQEERAGGGKVVRAFNEGYKHIQSKDYDFITKLDADLTLPVNYFEDIYYAFTKNERLGICGGTCYIEKNKILVKERAEMYHVRGALKSVRKECFIDIDGFMPELHWDGIDEFKARFHKWDVYSINTKVIHHRPTSKAYKPLKMNFRNGYAARQRRASFLLSFLRSINVMRSYPYLLNSFAYFFGFLYASIKGEKNILDYNISKEMNQFHYMKLFNTTKFNKKYLP